MANHRKRDHSKDARRIAQRNRTHNNLKDKFLKLIEKLPKHKDFDKWVKKIESL